MAGLAVLLSWWTLKGSQDFLHSFSMALYHRWGVKTAFTFALQFFMLISDSLGVVTKLAILPCYKHHRKLWITLYPHQCGQTIFFERVVEGESFHPHEFNCVVLQLILWCILYPTRPTSLNVMDGIAPTLVSHILKSTIAFTTPLCVSSKSMFIRFIRFDLVHNNFHIIFPRIVSAETIFFFE